MRWIAVALVAFLDAQGAAGVRGVVIDSASNQPIARASVLLVRPDAPAGALLATSDDLGRFAFAHPPPGSYRLRAERDGYMRGDLSAVIEVREGSVFDAALTLTPTAVISGRVTDEFGEPASRVVVRASIAGRAGGFEARTNDLGEYRLFGLPPGAYVIGAARYPGPRIETERQLGSRTIPGAALVTPTPPSPDSPGEGQFSQTLSSLLPAGGFIDPRALSAEKYPTVFYPGTTEQNAATPIKVTAGARIDAIDLTLVVTK